MSRRETEYAFGWAIALMLLTCVPYVWVWFFQPLKTVYPWILFNSDDHAVYHAWIRQARDGHFLFRNLFTNDPQRGIYLNVYFLLLGWLAKIPALDIVGASHLGRLVFGTLTLVLGYRLACFFTTDRFTRRCAFWTIGVSAGLGWLFWADRDITVHPVDVWQPEAFTFPSLYTNGLFCCAMVLMLSLVICLLLAEEHGWRWAVAGGVCGLLLANFHSYDTIHLTAVWAVYLLARGIAERRVPVRELGYGLLAAAITAPSMAYMYWFYRTEPVFYARVQAPTLSPEFRLYLWGYGPLIGLAIAGTVLLWRNKETTGRLRRLLLPVWATVGLSIAYLPVTFQRKLVMGTHFPLAILAAFSIAALARAAWERVRIRGVASMVAAAILLLLSLSNLRYLVRDVRLARELNVTSTGAHPAYWPESEIHAFEWLGAHAAPGATLLTYPTRGVLAPAYSGHPVYAGHWGETPDWENRMREVTRFYEGALGEPSRVDFLRTHRIEYVMVGVYEEFLIDEGLRYYGSVPLVRESYLHPVFHEGDTTLYEVVLPPGPG